MFFNTNFEDKKYAIETLEDFINNPLDFLIISGSACTGKNFLISKYAQYLNKKSINFVLLAPTGRAAKILSEKSGFEAKTIHSEIYSFTNMEVKEKNDESKIYFSLNINKNDKTIYIVDESSMISDVNNNDFLVFGSGKLLTDLITHIKYGKHNKIIFVGDNYQLPPVNSSFSPALDEFYLKEKFHLDGKKITLDKVVRQKSDSFILKNALLIKKHIQNNKFFDLNLSLSNDFVETPNLISQYDVNNTNNNIIICSTNKKALEYNKKIRKMKNLKQTFKIGDILLNTRNVHFQNQTILNGEFFEVLDIISNEKQSIYLRGKKPIDLIFYDLKLKNILTNNVLKFKVLANSLYTKSTSERDLQIALIVLTKNMVGNIKNNELHKHLENNPYFNALYVKYGYAIPPHKAQGGEWENVYVDTEFYNSLKSKEYFKWLYTSITRAKKKVYITPLQINSIENNNIKISDKYVIKNKIKIPVENEKLNKECSKVIHNKLIKNITSYNFKIISIKHFDYQEVYYLQKDNKYLKIQVFYNKKCDVTRIILSEATSEKIAKDFLNIFNAKNKNYNNTINNNQNYDCIKAFVDGSYDDNLKKFGSGLVIVKKDRIEKYCKNYSITKFIESRNVSGEIFATLLAFEYAKQENLKCIEINYDYEGIEKWALGYWKTKKEISKFYKEKYDYYSKFVNIKFKKIQAHSGNKYNDLADKLAKQAIYNNCKSIKYEIKI
ncbi:AAA family ATPase [Thermosipho sp. 1074]|uniref:AAA family ATPase n=1 Tax=Thermosipho sp. 1074 TaxID=1643331 RepID=UPI000984DF8C|nr:AAA family ATPase [Thermosipho sp. 1074]